MYVKDIGRKWTSKKNMTVVWARPASLVGTTAQTMIAAMGKRGSLGSIA